MKNKEMTYRFRGPFQSYCHKYVEYKKNIGFQFGDSAFYQLRYMDDFFVKYDLDSPLLTKEMVEDYVAHRGKESDKTQHMRMSLIRQFALFMNRIGFNFYVYPKVLIPIDKKFIPYIFTHEEIEKIIRVVDNLNFIPNSKYYHLIYPMLFRMLYACGLRINEALSLKMKDIDLENGILTITGAKKRTSRLVPMSSSLNFYCRNYVKKMSFTISYEGFYFPSRDGGKYHNTPVYIQFKKFMKKAGIIAEGEIGPRVHDIRHTFAVHALEKMVSEGQDIYCSLPILSTYLGHNCIESTEKYLRLTQEAFNAVINTVKPLYSNVFPEVISNENK